MQDKNFIYPINNIPLGKFDLGGVLYHANYFYLYELAREAFLKHLGHPYTELVKQGFHLAVVESHQQFNKAIFYGDLVEIQLSLSELSKAKICFNYEILSSNVKIHTAFTKHAFIKSNAGKFSVSRFEEDLFNKLNTYLKN